MILEKKVYLRGLRWRWVDKRCFCYLFILFPFYIRAFYQLEASILTNLVIYIDIT